jgi:flagellar motor switch protein FliN/FliY
MSDMSEAPRMGQRRSEGGAGNFDLLAGVSLRVSVEVGSASMKLADLLNVAEGSIIELDRQADDLLDILANGTLIARGEVVVVDGRYGVRIAEVASIDAGLGGMERRA